MNSVINRNAANSETCAMAPDTVAILPVRLSALSSHSLGKRGIFSISSGFVVAIFPRIRIRILVSALLIAAPVAA